MPDWIKYALLVLVLIWAANHPDDVKWLISQIMTLLGFVTT